MSGVTQQETITISLDEYRALVDAENFLTCLENAGVDNWAGYDCAREEFKGMVQDQ